MTDITLPEDTGKSRLPRAPHVDKPDDVATAGERIEAFWERHPDGSILTEVEAREIATTEHLPYFVYTVRAFVRKDGDSTQPDATAHATRSEADPDPMTAQYAQETAETSAVSRALRYIGILPVGRPTPAPAAPAPAPVAKTPARPGVVASARQELGLTQTELAKAMRDAGHPWTQVIVSKVERGKRDLTEAEAATLATLIALDVR